MVNKTFTPVITANSDILEQIREGGFPEMLGYVGTTLKSNATAVLMDDKKESPILATWQYGLGTTAAFTTDVVMSGQLIMHSGRIIRRFGAD